MKIPGFTAEASLGRGRFFRARRTSERNFAVNAVNPFITVGGGGGGGPAQCPAGSDSWCIDCSDDVRNIVCSEWGQGGDLQCCDDPPCVVVNGGRPIIDCTIPSVAGTCYECGLGGSSACCLFPDCEIILPPRTLPPPGCFSFRGRIICNGAGPTTFSNSPVR